MPYAGFKYFRATKIFFRVFPREHHADIPPTSPKKAKSRFCSQKMRNVLKRLQKEFSDFLIFFHLTKFYIQPFLSFDEKFSYTWISFKLGSAYVSEDSKKMIKNIHKKMFQKKKKLIFLGKKNFSQNHLSRILIQSREKSQTNIFCSKIKNCVRGPVAKLENKYFFVQRSFDGNQIDSPVIVLRRLFTGSAGDVYLFFVGRNVKVSRVLLHADLLLEEGARGCPEE